MAHSGEVGRREPSRVVVPEGTQDPVRRASDPLAGPAVVLAPVVAVLAPLTLTTGRFVTVFLAGALVASFASMLAWSVAEVRSLGANQALLRALRRAAAGGVLAVAAAVVVVVLGTYGWAVVLASVPAHLLGRHALGRTRHKRLPCGPPAPAVEPAHAPAPTSVGGPAVSGLCLPPFERCSTSELRAAWGATYELLQVTSSAFMKARIASLRRSYLDELERRDPEGVRRWLTSTADPAGDPGEYVQERDAGGEPRAR